MPTSDLIKSLGTLALASRLKRVSERLMKDVSRLYREMDVKMEPRWFPVLNLLGRKSPLAITEISGRLKLTHPAINQVAGQMEKAGLVKSHKDRTDERRRLLSLTPAGRQLIGKLQPLWQDIKIASGELIRVGGTNILDCVTALEDALEHRDVYQRVHDLQRRRLEAEIEIISYRPAYKKYFRDINRAWLREYFSIECIDRDLLDDPNGQILKKGGSIFFARLKGQIVGTAALLRTDDNGWELAKMGVLKKYRGLGIGTKIAQAIISGAKRKKAKELILYTSPQLKEALHLYRKLGFRICKSGKADKFKRCTIVMKLRIK